MTINTNNSIQPGTLNRMVQLAVRGQNGEPDCTDSALKVLNQCGLSEEQSAKIASILGNVPSENAGQATTAMKERILAVLNGEELNLQVVPNAPAPFASLNQNREIYIPTANCTFVGDLIDDVAQKIFFQCHSNSDYQGILSLGCVNKHYNKCTEIFWEKFDLRCCKELTILDAKTQGITIDDEPRINKLQVLKCIKDLISHIENNEGVTLLTMRKGLTLNQLVAIAAEKGMTVDIVWDRILQEQGDVPVEQTYVILITNNVFVDSRSKDYASQRDIVIGYGCEMPTVQEYVALCVFTNKCFQKYLYGGNPLTFGRTSTHVGSHSLIVGGASAPGRLLGVYRSHWDNESKGVGGRRKF
jgi:hypothetical protein